MPKMKSCRAAMKRYRFTASGKVKHAKQGKRHNLHVKTEERKRGMNRGIYLPEADARHVRARLLPYGSR